MILVVVVQNIYSNEETNQFFFASIECYCRNKHQLKKRSSHLIRVFNLILCKQTYKMVTSKNSVFSSKFDFCFFEIHVYIKLQLRFAIEVIHLLVAITLLFSLKYFSAWLMKMFALLAFKSWGTSKHRYTIIIFLARHKIKETNLNQGFLLFCLF